MALTSITSRRIDFNLSELLRIVDKKAGTGELRSKIERGREALTALGTALSTLRASLARINAAPFAEVRSVRDGRVQTVSPELGLAEGESALALADTGIFADVAAGSIEVGGVSIAVDPETDSLEDVVARINASGSGVTATFSSGRLKLVSAASRRPLAVDDGGTGLFDAAGIVSKTYAPEKEVRSEFLNPEELAVELKKAAKALDGLFSGEFSELDEEIMGSMRAEVVKVMREAAGGAAVLSDRTLVRTGFGIDFDFGPSAKTVMKVDVKKLVGMAGKDFEGLRAFLFGEEGSLKSSGLAPALIEKLDSTINAAVEALGNKLTQGALVDLKG